MLYKSKRGRLRRLVAANYFAIIGRWATRWPLLMIAVWLAVPTVLFFATPSLSQVMQEHPIPMVPADSPAMQTANKMAEAFHESGDENLLLVVLTNDHGLGPADEAVYHKLVERLKADTADVVMVHDFVTTPQLRDTLTSKDNKAWVVPVGLAGGLDTPQGTDAYNNVLPIIRDTVGSGPLTVHITGPAATIQDLTVVGDQDMLRIEIATAAMVLLILLIVYRNPRTMMLPLVTIGLSLLTARGVVAALSTMGLGVCNEQVILMTAMMFGAGTDYAVFLISRYHEELRTGLSSDEAVVSAVGKIGKVVAASAATVAVTFLCMAFAKLGLLSTVGPALAISVVVALIAAFTLLPALLILAGRRGWVNPPRDLTTRFWHRSGERIVKRPVAHLLVSVAVLAILAGFGCFVTFNWDESRTLPADTDSNRGYAALNQHFPLDATIPLYLVVHSPNDLRQPGALADLEVMASRVRQVPNVAAVRGITRPNGKVPEEATVAHQAGEVGSRLADAAREFENHRADIDQLTNGANELASSLAEVQGEIHDAVSGASDVAALLDDPQVWQAQATLREITNSGVLNDLSEIASELPEVPEAREIASDVAELSQTLSAASNTIGGLGLSGSAGAQLSEIRSGADRLAAGSAQLADGVHKLVDATNRMVSGLQEASAFLLNLKRDASGNATMGGFFIPASALRDTDLRDAAQIFVSPDGHTVRYLVQSSLNPFSNEIMDQLNAITDVAHNAQPNTALADAQIEMTGFPAINHDLRDYYQRDMKFVMAATLIVVFLILVLLLRAIVAPLYLIASVVVSYLSALGLGVIAFQVIGHQPLSWSVPGMAFIVLVAVGADYNMLLISRVRDESPHSVRTGVIKTVASTGGVITSAGLIFAASMFGLLFGNISGMVQSGFIIGVGLLLDTFLVRTVTVPALAVLIGRANWWPTLWGRPPVPLEPVADYAEIETVDAELVPVSVDLATSDLRVWWTAESVYDRTVRETGINPELLEPVIPEFKWRRWSSRDAAMPFPVLPDPCGVANDDDADLQLELEMLELEASQSLLEASQSLREAIAR